MERYRCIDPGGRYLEMDYGFTDDDTGNEIFIFMFFFFLILFFDLIDGKGSVLILALVKIEEFEF